MRQACIIIKIFLATIWLSACQNNLFQKLSNGDIPVVDKIGSVSSEIFNKESTANNPEYAPLNSIVKKDFEKIDFSDGFSASVKRALLNDPKIIGAEKDLLARSNYVIMAEAQKDYQVSGTVLGGFEDVSDGTKGVAIILNARRMLFDGGAIDAQVSKETLTLESQKHLFESIVSEKGVELLAYWIDLERYQTINNLVEIRLDVLAPLIEQLEQVAAAGVGDVARVAGAQRTVTSVMSARMQMQAELNKATINFINSFGNLPGDTVYNQQLISELVPTKITESLIERSPALRADYAAYQAAVVNKIYVASKNNLHVGLEARATRPFAGSGYDSDETVGIVFNKILYNGKLHDSEIEQAEMIVQATKAAVRSTYLTGSRVIETAYQSLITLNESIELANLNATVMEDEIVHLRKQLIIGGSTLDSVLSAEARLFEAQAQVINLTAERRKAELAIAGTLGLLAPI
jgi:outer membrane protein TolC